MQVTLAAAAAAAATVVVVGRAIFIAVVCFCLFVFVFFFSWNLKLGRYARCNEHYFLCILNSSFHLVNEFVSFWKGLRCLNDSLAQLLNK